MFLATRDIRCASFLGFAPTAVWTKQHSISRRSFYVSVLNDNDEENEKNQDRNVPSEKTGLSSSSGMLGKMKELKGRLKAYGKAGIAAVAIETTLFWLLFLLPAASYVTFKVSEHDTSSHLYLLLHSKWICVI